MHVKTETPAYRYMAHALSSAGNVYVLFSEGTIYTVGYEGTLHQDCNF
jgi:hypothetical protein